MGNPARLPSGSSANETSTSGGDQRHQMAGNTMTMVASQKLGVAKPRMASDRPT